MPQILMSLYPRKRTSIRPLADVRLGPIAVISRIIPATLQRQRVRHFQPKKTFIDRWKGTAFAPRVENPYYRCGLDHYFSIRGAQTAGIASTGTI